VLNLDAMEESDRLERGDWETTITTNVAGAELTTWTGHQYSQIPETHAESNIEELGETSRQRECVGRSVIGDMTAEPEKDQMSEADLCRSRDMGDVTEREQEVREREEGTCEVPTLDDVPDQPSSPMPTATKESQPIQDDRQEVLGDGGMSTEPSADHEASFNADISDGKKSTMEENIGVHTSLDEEELDNPPDEIIPILQSASIDCSSENYNVQSQPSPGERQRPIRNASRPTRYRDAAFDTQFQPMPRRHRRIRRRDATANYITNKEACFRLGRGVKEKHTKNPPDPAKTSTASQKRLSPAALRSLSTSPPQASSTHSSTATGVKINKTVINARPDRCRTTRPTAAAAAVGNQPVEALSIQKTKVNISNNGKTDTTSVSIPGKIQTTNVGCPTTSTHQNASHQTRVHPHRFRRKKCQKRQRQTRHE